jgi:DNA-binding winged helix-turn-helix (wHTH) protein/tetratricopeptide (TPR) repeat protein
MAQAYLFGGFRLDAATRELWRGAELLVLPPKIFETLVWLIEHRDRAVGRDELIAAVWGQTDIPDNLLAQVIARLRRLVDDGLSGDSAIRTIPRFGYRWVAPTAVADEADSIAPDLATKVAAQPTSTRRSRRTPWWVVVAVVLGLAAVVGAGIAWFDAPQAPEHASEQIAPEPVTIARLALVLPARIDAPAEHAWLRLGVMALVSQRLREAGQPVMPSDNVVALLRDNAPTNGDPDESGLALAAPYAQLVLDVHARLDGATWRVALRTVRGREPSLETRAAADDPLDAARAAADRMAQRLGYAPVRERITSTIDGTVPARLLFEIEAATLAGQVDRARSLLDGATDAQREAPELRYRHAWIEFIAGRLQPAQDAFEGLLGELPPADAPLMRARTLNGLANVQYRRGDIDGLLRSSQAAATLLRDLDAPGELARALMGRATAGWEQGDAVAAQRDFAQARVAFESAGDRLGVARAELALGTLAKLRNRLGEALPLLGNAAASLAAFHDVHDELLARSHWAHVQLLRLEPAAALAVEARLGELAERERDPEARALAELTRIDVLRANGRLAAARSVLGRVCRGNEADARCAAQPWPLGFALARANLAGPDAAALRELEAAVRAVEPGQAGRDAARAWLVVLRDAAQRGDLPRLRELHEVAMRWSAARPDRQSGTDSERHLYLELMEARYAAVDGRPGSARAAFQTAIGKAESTQVPADLLWASSAFAGWLIARGEFAEASVAAGRVAGWADRDFDAAVLQLRLQHALGREPAWRTALDRARSLAGERAIPAELLVSPHAAKAGAE